MASVNAQSVEDFADRIVYRYPAGRYEQAAVIFENAVSPGLKTLVNTDTSRQYNIPASGINFRFFRIDWFFNVCLKVNQSLGGGQNMQLPMHFLKYSTPSPALNYDGKSLQTEFYENTTQNIIVAQQLRAINIADIAVDPIMPATNFIYTAQIQFDINNPNAQLIALLQPVVTAYKK